MSRRILVLGDTGLLGQALVAKGRALGFDVRGASRRSSDVPLDACDAAALEQTFDALQPDVVVNAAGLIDVNQCEQAPAAAWLANARLPAQLATVCAPRGIRLVHISTDHYYSGDGNTPHDESHPVVFLNEYSRTKYAGECMVLTYPQALVIRTNIVGFRWWNEAPTFVEWLLDALEKEVQLELYADFHTSSISATQLADLIFELLETTAAGVLNVASRQGATKLEFASALAAACGLSTRATRPGSVRSAPGVRRAESLVLSTRLAERLLTAPLPDLNAVVQQLAKEYSEHKSCNKALK